FGRPFLDRYETPIGLVGGEERLVFVWHFLIQFRRAIAGRFGQEISNRADALVVFRCPPALCAAAVARILSRSGYGGATFPAGSGLDCWPWFRFPAIRRRF